jgi:hypothetical protein
MPAPLAGRRPGVREFPTPVFLGRGGETWQTQGPQEVRASSCSVSREDTLPGTTLHGRHRDYVVVAELLALDVSGACPCRSRRSTRWHVVKWEESGSRGVRLDGSHGVERRQGRGKEREALASSFTIREELRAISEVLL